MNCELVKSSEFLEFKVWSLGFRGLGFKVLGSKAVISALARAILLPWMAIRVSQLQGCRVARWV